MEPAGSVGREMSAMARFHRSWRTATLAVLLMLTSVGAAVAQEPVQQTAPPLDVAALAPFPQDFGIDGLGMCCGELLYIEEMIASIAQDGLTTASEARTALDEANWRQRYIAIYDQSETGDGEITEQITITIDEHDSAEGASAGYDFWTTHFAGELGYTDLGELDQPLGDQASAWSWAPTPEDEIERIAIVMTDDRFGMELALDSFTGEPPSLDDALTYAGILRDHVVAQADQEQPGLGWRMLRVIDGPPRSVTFPDNYLRLHGEDIVRSLETAGAVAARSAEFGDVTNVYNVEFGLPNGGWYAVRIYEYPSEDVAEAVFAGLATGAAERDAPFGLLVPDAPTFGDESFVVSYNDVNTIDGEGETAVTGFTARVRVGNLYVRLLLDGPDNPPIEAIAWLVETQLNCLASGEPCPPILFMGTPAPGTN